MRPARERSRRGEQVLVAKAEEVQAYHRAHSDARGTKKAISDSIFEAGANNIQSTHRDFPKVGIAYDLSAIDRPLSDAQLHGLVENARAITGDDTAIRALRQFRVDRD